MHPAATFVPGGRRGAFGDRQFRAVFRLAQSHLSACGNTEFERARPYSVQRPASGCRALSIAASRPSGARNGVCAKAETTRDSFSAGV